MTALISDTSFSSGSGGRPIRFFGRSRMRSIRLERETPITSATVFIGNRPSAATAAAAAVFLTPWRVLEDLGFQRLLAEQPLQLAHLALQGSIIRSRHHLFAAAGSRQRPLHHQPAPGEELVRGNAMSASHQAYRHARLERLLDDPNLLRRGPAPTALNRCDDLNSIRSIGHRHGCMPHTCQVGDRVRSVRGLSHLATQSLPAGSAPPARGVKAMKSIASMAGTKVMRF